MSVLNVYKYHGVCLSTRLTFCRDLSDRALRAIIGVVNILKQLWSLAERSPLIFSKLFNCLMYKTQPILNYGTEVLWLEADLNTIEKIQLFALKRFLNVSSQAQNIT